jgi:hypothetical protein
MKLKRITAGQWRTPTGFQLVKTNKTRNPWTIWNPEGNFVRGNLRTRTASQLWLVEYLRTNSERNDTVHGPTDQAVAKLREEYRQIMTRACAVHGMTPTEFTNKVMVKAGNNATPQQLLDAAIVLRFECPECSGSGKYYSGGAVVNGVYTGSTGTCFRCSGHGAQDAYDRKRNHWYDVKYRRVVIG